MSSLQRRIGLFDCHVLHHRKAAPWGNDKCTCWHTYPSAIYAGKRLDEMLPRSLVDIVPSSSLACGTACSTSAPPTLPPLISFYFSWAVVPLPILRLTSPPRVCLMLTGLSFCPPIAVSFFLLGALTLVSFRYLPFSSLTSLPPHSLLLNLPPGLRPPRLTLPSLRLRVEDLVEGGGFR